LSVRMNPLGDAVALWLFDVRRADSDAEPLHLVDPGIRGIVDITAVGGAPGGAVASSG